MVTTTAVGHKLRVLGQVPVILSCGVGALLGLDLSSEPETIRLEKKILITGGNAGIGRCAATRFAGAGAEVILACRSREKGAEAKKEILKKHPRATVRIVELDLLSLESVRRCAAKLKNETLDVVVLNAGINTNTPTKVHPDLRCSTIFGVNFVSHWLLLNLLPKTKRVVCLSSVCHQLADPQKFRLPDDNELLTLAASILQEDTSPLIEASYNESKLAMNLLARAIMRRDPDVLPLLSQQLTMDAVAVNPGFVQSDIWRHTWAPAKPFFEFVISFVTLHPDQGAATTVAAASNPTPFCIDDYTTPYYQPLPLSFPLSGAFEFVGPFAGPQKAFCRLPRDEVNIASDLWRTCAALCGDFLKPL